MSKKIKEFTKWTVLLVLTGISAAIAASLMIFLIELIQGLSFGITHGSFDDQISYVNPIRRFFSVCLSGLLAAFGWHYLSKYLNPSPTITEIVHKDKEPKPSANFLHGLLQMATVSMGSPLGREGASREAAVAITGSWLPFIKLDKNKSILLLACASGAALGAVYNAPLATLIFIMENVLLSWSWKNAYAASVTSFIAVGFVNLVFGSEIQYKIQQLEWNTDLFIWSLISGCLLAIIIYTYKSLLESSPKKDPKSINYLIFVPLSFILVAILSLYFPEILGNGKAGLIYYFNQPFSATYAFPLFLAKALAVYITFYAGAYGGRIAPSMMMGGALGLFTAQLSNMILHSHIPIQFAILIGAALFLAIINNIPIAAVLFLLEITGQPLINGIPVAMAMASAYLTIYFLKKFDPKKVVKV
ncbi:voltage gated chloride channel [Streptococcus parauberis]|uniref:chloride channel protein n=1 Tax=Streptococcus parauberis TaxID=1348 RepID=UPI0004484428|nr:chloride channel protein [Streptococcus parauberis]GAJ61453.1 voltage gated chloride channel [Streptococcus parauberis]